MHTVVARRPYRSARHILAAVEAVEARLVFNNTYHNLAAGQFVQSWTTTSQFTVDDNWDNVPSVIGYRGDGLTGSPGTNPQTVTAFGGGVVDVNVNQTNTALTTGGVTQFTITDPVVGLKGSGTADDPFINIHLNATGQSSIPVHYRLRDLDNSANNAQMQIAAQYRLSDSGTYTDIPAGYVSDATTGPSTNGPDIDVNFTLPSACDNQSTVQLRIITSDANGTDEYVGIDDIQIGNVPTPATMQFAGASFSVNENVVGGNATITVTRTGDLSVATSVMYATIAGGTATPVDDYTAVSGTLAFDVNQTTNTFFVPIVDDMDPENAETINLQLSMPAAPGVLGTPVNATLTIVDNDNPTPNGILLNEVEVNPPGSDQPFEYIEIRGNAGQSLSNVYLISMEGDGSGAGIADLVFNLTGNTLDTNGLLVIKATTGGHTIPAGTNVVMTTAFDPGTTQSMENGANSFLVVFSTAAIVQGSDYDTNNDGALDLPAGASLLDGAGYKDGGNGTVYGADITPPPAEGGTGQPFTPQAITRFPTNTAPLASAAWYSGQLQITANGSAEVLYNQDTSVDPPGSHSTVNSPAGAMITPGAANFGPTDSTPPTVDTATFVFDQPLPVKHLVQLDFSEDVQASLALADITLTNLTTNTTIPSADLTLAYTTGTDIASISYTPGAVVSALPDGNYRLTLAAGSVQDAAGNQLAQAFTFDFFVFAGDANHDRSVNISDFSALASNFNLAGTFSLGDFNYSGTVEIGDFSILASRFNTTLPAPRFTNAVTTAARLPIGYYSKLDPSVFSDKDLIEQMQI